MVQPPPWNEGVKTNVGKKFLNIIENFKNKNKGLGKISNKNFCKISYRTSPNLGKIISSHNQKILRRKNKQTERECSCREKEKDNCPLGGKCLLKNIIYQANITPETNTKNFNKETYIGLTSNSFKARLANHRSSFKNVNKKYSSKLAEYVWKLQENNVKYEIKWNLICRANTFSTVSNTCNLCINEKMYIVYFPEMGSLNSKSELTSNCRHRSNLLLDKT